MGQIREVDALSDAIVATEREIAGEAWDIEDTDPADETGDRTLESIGEGLEGQQEASEEDDAEGSEEQEAEESEEGEAEGETEETAGEGEGAQAQQRQQAAEQPAGRVPSGKYREIAERARLAEEERDRLRAQVEAQPKADPKLAALEAQVTTLTQLLQGQRAPARTEPEKQPAAAEVPDIFENPKGFVEHITNLVQNAVAPVRTDMRKQAVETSFAIAHSTHKDTFSDALKAINGLDPSQAEDRSIVQRIYNSANPGEALVSWHKRSQTLARVGDDPTAYEERIRNETRQSLLKDPEFRKQLLADLRQEASAGENGSPRTQNRLPPSLKRAPGASSQGERFDHSASDDTDQGVADAAWR